ncbi:hypothetical protein HS041_14390 [Planomonospora sp. ID67723]|uniref:DUF6082 family protein n=1 Tax=Planomonospora sp. ID67723 TaxID=2738134 RepID=UPI0018C37077|nr:DUF6082 family protein [Planomonospora sp. ID67723]MBG0828960.1 hypothetical protein [Planomonospora sp. ID67723]
MSPRRLSERLLTRGLPRRVLTAALLLVVITLVAGLVAVSPLALGLLGDQAGDWERLSLIGQTYGAASTLLSVLALVGVAVSLVLQAREAKSDREQALRMLHADLMKMAMEDPLYRRAWGPFFDSDDPDTPREHMYVNLIVSQWSMEYELRTITEEHLRPIARTLFSGPAGRRYWTNVRELRITSTSTRRERRFHRILDEEFHAAHEPPPSSPASPSSPPAPASPSPPGPATPPAAPVPRGPAVTASPAPFGGTARMRPALLTLLTLLAVPAAVRAARRLIIRRRAR